MQCRYCAGEWPDESQEFDVIEQLKGITGEFLIYHYPEKFDYVYEWTYWLSSTNPLFEAKQTARFTHHKSGFVVEKHLCFERKQILFRASGVAPQNTRDIEGFTGFFSQVIRDTETAGQTRRIDPTL